jgi:hypothetical protein
MARPATTPTRAKPIIPKVGLQVFFEPEKRSVFQNKK